ncbi:hypothetical protein AXF42_Ash019281 [Apostasia shenzhenica]|uniref:Uncharacterized protein n=1 Tax=Apostasia shenzhenica TaxID=1088818 RepID=A0A2I0AR76_9ASPA|nr:hypothetical protein AXF42_Ash019281 [Apostasia shenzhenica]
MSSLYHSPTAAALATFLLFASLSLTTPIYTHNSLQLRSRRSLLSLGEDDDLDSSISKSKLPPKKKSVSEYPDTSDKPKTLKTKKTNSTSSSSSPVISTSASKTKLNKTLSSAAAAAADAVSKLNRTLTGTKSKLNKTTTALAIKAKLNKTIITAKNTTTKLPKLMKPLKSNSTKISPKSDSSKTVKSDSPEIQRPKSLKSVPVTQKKLDEKDPPTSKANPVPKPKPKPSPASWLDETDVIGDEDDIISEFRDLPSRLHSALVPDLEKLSTTSKLYLSKTHREIAAGVKPFVGKKYAPSIASAASAALIVLPLVLVTALFRHLIRIGSSASLQRALLFVQAYLAIYFATLSLTAVVTGLEPLRFFYAASPSAYAWTQAVQTFGYVVYLVAQLIAMVVAFSAGEGKGAAGKAVVLAQMLLGLAVGMHYYITVFHRAVAGEQPRANWQVHGVYAACFLVICALGRAERRKKAYWQNDRGDDGKKS